MVEADVGNDAQVGTDDVGAVQPAAQSYFDDGHVNLFVGKVAECHGGGQFEERGRQWLEEVAFLFDEAYDIFLRNGLTVDTDAFAEVH